MKIKVTAACLLAVLGAAAFGGENEFITVSKLCLCMGERASASERNCVELFARRVRARTGMMPKVATEPQGQPVLFVGTPGTSGAIAALREEMGESAALGKDGFYLMSRPDAKGRMALMAESACGLAAGLGRLLRSSRFNAGSLELPVLELTENPKLPVRGIYLATHFHNFYQTAPLEKVLPIIEDIALWGGSHIQVWFDMQHFSSFQSPEAQAHCARLRAIADAATGLGMKFGLAFIANEGYADSPAELRMTRVDPRQPERVNWHAYGCELCPSKPEGLKLIGQWQKEELDAFPQVDVIWSWPYDAGGCWCEDCLPWAGNGYMKATEQLARIYKARFPRGEVYLSNWELWGDDLKAMVEYIDKNAPDWLTGLFGCWEVWPAVADPKYVRVAFPEISMGDISPWGDYGANPMPRKMENLIKTVVSRNAIGGWVYSEGIYEDINKFLWLRHCWDPQASSAALLKEYAAYYFSPAVAGQFAELCELLEKVHSISYKDGKLAMKGLDCADAIFAKELAAEIDENIPAARALEESHWRWELVRIRTAIHRIAAEYIASGKDIASHEGRSALRPWFHALARLYYTTENTRGAVRPPQP